MIESYYIDKITQMEKSEKIEKYLDIHKRRIKEFNYKKTSLKLNLFLISTINGLSPLAKFCLGFVAPMIVFTYGIQLMKETQQDAPVVFLIWTVSLFMLLGIETIRYYRSLSKLPDKIYSLQQQIESVSYQIWKAERKIKLLLKLKSELRY